MLNECLSSGMVLPKLFRSPFSRLNDMTQDANDPFASYFPGGFTVRDEANALVA